MPITNYIEGGSREQPFRILIAGCSGSGKSNILLNLIYEKLQFDRLYFCAKDLTEQSYEKLMKQYTKYDGIKKTELRKKYRQLIGDYEMFAKDAYFYNCQEDMVCVDDLDKTKTNLVVFDDCITDKNQDKITEFFIRGRKKNAHVIYLSQSYYATPITIRRNCNVFIFCSIRKRDIGIILREIDGNFPQKLKLKPYDFIVLNTDTLTDRYVLNRLNI